MDEVTTRDYVKTLFPDGIPRLWCPPLTHFTPDGRIDEKRMRAHLRFLSPSIRAILVPGTTGEGWELSDSESARLLRFVVEAAPEFDFRVLIGVLKPTADQMVETAQRIAAELGVPSSNKNGMHRALAQRRIAGFTFCAPRGSLSQAEIHAALDRVLSLGLPSALYQLPQVTGNEFDPQTLQKLSRIHENLFLVKDSSGHDRVLTSGLDFGGLFFVRGAEGDYAKWYGEGAVGYDGFLLSTANCFPRELSILVDPSASGSLRREVSDEITSLINETFNAVQIVGEGNLFTNANKAVDHFNAHGPGALGLAGPRLHGGAVISAEVLAQVGKILERHGRLAAEGYLERS